MSQRVDQKGRDEPMKTKTTAALAALILVAGGGAALAQEGGPRGDHPQDGRGEGRPGWRQHSAEARQPAPAPAASMAPPAPAPAHAAPPRMGPGEGRAFAPGRGDHAWPGRSFAPGERPAEVAPQGPPPDHRQWSRDRAGPGPQWQGRPQQRAPQVVGPDADRWRGGPRPGAQVIPNRPEGERFRDVRPDQRFGAGDRQRFVQQHDRTGWDHDRPHWDQHRYPHMFRSHHRFHRGRFFWPRGFGFREFAFGEFLPPIFWTSPDYLIEDWWDYDLPYPPPGYEWVRAGDDALLVDEYDGRIVQVIREIFW